MVAGAKGDPLKPIRILLGRMSPLLLDMLHHVVASNPSMTVVGQVGDADLLAVLLGTGLACLAPDIVTAIVEGRQPLALTAATLLAIQMPLCWKAQRAMLGFS